jgi:hypothetical protein
MAALSTGLRISPCVPCKSALEQRIVVKRQVGEEATIGMDAPPFKRHDSLEEMWSNVTNYPTYRKPSPPVVAC